MYQESTQGEMFSVEIICDKCQSRASFSSTLGKEIAKKFLYDSGWRMNSAARKYVHLCRSCGLKAKARKVAA